MGAVLSFFNQGWVGVLVGAIGIAVAIYTIFRRTKGRLLYQQTSIRLLDAGRNSVLDSVSVLYGDKKVPRVSLTHVAIWNSGRSAVRSTDVSEHGPIKFELNGDGEILDATIVASSVPENNPTFIISDDRKSFLLNFSFLNPKQGFIVRTIHTADKSDVLIGGTLIDLPAIGNAGRLGMPSTRNFGGNKDVLVSTSKTFVGLYLLIIGVALIVLGTFFRDYMTVVDQTMFALSQAYGWLLGIVMGVPMILGSLLLLASRRAPPDALIAELSSSAKAPESKTT
ncbi:hypothetical protein EN870_07590 [bacterium M00.F.Ca.ET.227.01.1.1]|nr:hypothetical protein EN870_07590 [bacterium M00.F.Ca.ET.227.01.1.1]TGU38903.1 hypothetical protein EN799_09375 [bacterium M00.F.Ca.ET.156.01.1.1]